MEDARPPPCPNLAHEAANMAEYSSKYATKSDQPSNTMLLCAAVAILARDNAAAPAGPASGLPAPRQHLCNSDVGRLHITRALNGLHRSMTFPAPIAALYLLRSVGDSTSSFQCTYYPYRLFTQRLLPTSASADAPEEVVTQVVAGPSDGARCVNMVDDYRMRGATLAGLSPYEFCASIEKLPFTDPQRWSLVDRASQRCAVVVGKRPAKRPTKARPAKRRAAEDHVTGATPRMLPAHGHVCISLANEESA